MCGSCWVWDGLAEWVVSFSSVNRLSTRSRVRGNTARDSSIGNTAIQLDGSFLRLLGIITNRIKLDHRTFVSGIVRDCTPRTMTSCVKNCSDSVRSGSGTRGFFRHTIIRNRVGGRLSGFTSHISGLVVSSHTCLRKIGTLPGSGPTGLTCVRGRHHVVRRHFPSTAFAARLPRVRRRGWYCDCRTELLACLHEGTSGMGATRDVPGNAGCDW